MPNNGCLISIRMGINISEDCHPISKSKISVPETLEVKLEAVGILDIELKDTHTTLFIHLNIYSRVRHATNNFDSHGQRVALTVRTLIGGQSLFKPPS